MNPTQQARRLASTIAMQCVAVYATGLIVAITAAWRGSDRTPLDWAVMALPAALFTPAAFLAVRGYRASGARTSSQRALVLAALGTGLLAVAIAVWRAA